jgi:hypothetical protein
VAEEKKVESRVASTIRFRIEMGDYRNRNFVWPLDARTLRGRFSRNNIASVVIDERFSSVPDISGILLELNGAKNTFYMMDPLAHPSNREAYEQIKHLVDTYFAGNFVHEFHPTGVMAFRDLTKDEFKSICYYARRFADARQCFLINGSIPDMNSILALPGQVMFENYDSGHTAKKLRDPERYIPVKVEEGKKIATIVEVDFD